MQLVEQVHIVRPDDELVVRTCDFGDPTWQGILERARFKLIKWCKDAISRAIFR